MKTFFALLAAAVVLSLGSVASAGVFVHAGPVHVAVGVPHRPIHPVAARPIIAPVARPIIAPVARPVIAPVAPVQPVFQQNAVVEQPESSISLQEARQIREEARELRHEILDAGRVLTPRERLQIREEAWQLRQDIRQALQN